jgi:hypothetical protein
MASSLTRSGYIRTCNAYVCQRRSEVAQEAGEGQRRTARAREEERIQTGLIKGRAA